MPELREYTATKRQSAREYEATVRHEAVAGTALFYSAPSDNQSLNFQESDPYSAPSDNQSLDMQEKESSPTADAIPRSYEATSRSAARSYTASVSEGFAE